MPIKLTILIIGTNAQGMEQTYSRLEADTFDVFQLDSMIESALTEAVKFVHGKDDDALRFSEPELSIRLIGTEVRPAFHLSSKIIKRLADANASIDFDPYV